jgi:hypothetical protein
MPTPFPAGRRGRHGVREMHLEQVRLCEALQQKYWGLSMIQERVTGGKTGMRPNQKKQAKMKADAWYPQPPSH